MSKIIKVYDSASDMAFNRGLHISRVSDHHRREDGSWSISVDNSEGGLDNVIHIPPGKIVQVRYAREDDKG